VEVKEREIEKEEQKKMKLNCCRVVDGSGRRKVGKV
jgi:hypothetical protein